jgi:hypothetical protein
MENDFASTIKSEDSMNSNSDGGQTLFIGTEEVLQAEVYGCKEEFRDEFGNYRNGNGDIDVMGHHVG